jgi:hypothetical protein
VTAGFQFADHLYVHYKPGKAPPEYKQLYQTSSDAMVSQLMLIDDAVVAIQANGMYYEPQDLISSGYWGWREKIATMLPFDYRPKN